MASRLRDDSTEDDVQFLYEITPDPVVCQICQRSLDRDTSDERAAHYQTHFEDEPQASASSTPSPQKSQPSFKAKVFDKAHHLFHRRNQGPAQDVFWCTSHTGPLPDNHTLGLIPLLKKQLGKSKNTQRAWLCSETAVHIAIESFDRGWGCGYRNFLMCCSALIAQTEQPLYFPLLDDPISPGVRNLQLWIEDAWSKGFDKEGADQLKHKLFETSKWIGTAELWVAFSSRGIPSHLVDFHIRGKEDVDLLLTWIEDYFTKDASKPSQNALEALKGASSVAVTNKMPIVLQHLGHSRTIVGFERCENGSINLLEFDPSKRIPSNIRQAALAKSLPSPANSKGSKHAGVKRPAGNTLKVAAKRIRSGTRQDAIVIDSDDETTTPVVASKPGSPSKANASEPVLNTMEVLKFFRLSAKSLQKKKYQILYFPLTAPLSDAERRKRRVVMSFKVERDAD